MVEEDEEGPGIIGSDGPIMEGTLEEEGPVIGSDGPMIDGTLEFELASIISPPTAAFIEF